ncbi:MAG: type III pantothenate kinase [Glaciimonas sp.]|nr:type III pantothenate kinase [Glaciimonas sp.]
MNALSNALLSTLFIDAGNTRIKWALLDDPIAPSATPSVPTWSACGSVTHANMAELPVAWSNARALKRSTKLHALISNVAGSAMRLHLEKLLTETFGADVTVTWFASEPQLAGIRNAYRDPTQLGCDRFATAIAAHYLFPQQTLLVVTCGTATTIDAISEHGVFVGGMILPGLGTMASSLARNTAQLPLPSETDYLGIAAHFADNTDDAIVSGCIIAQVGAIEHAITLQERHLLRMPQMTTDNVTCILAGGAANYIAPHLSHSYEIVDNLVLIGLALVALKTAPITSTSTEIPR